MKSKNLEKRSAICPQCKENRTFILTTEEPMAPLQLYRCEECRVLVSTFYLNSGVIQRAYLGRKPLPKDL